MRAERHLPAHLCILLGGGGHAMVLLDCLQASGAASPVGILDREEALWGRSVLGCPVLGGDQLLPQLTADGRADSFVVSLGGVGDNRPRARLFGFGRQLGLAPLTVAHPAAVVSRFAELGAGCQLLPGSIVNAGAHLGENVLVNSGAIVEHGCEVGEHAHISTGACLGGGAAIGALSHVGIGAVVRQGIRVGRNSLIGAGAVVVDDVEDDVVVVGVPARVMRRRSEHG
jgi:sugar O-acyltransferase (sialic acid O-acetyltransferase NeuD family)